MRMIIKMMSVLIRYVPTMAQTDECDIPLLLPQMESEAITAKPVTQSVESGDTEVKFKPDGNENKNVHQDDGV